MMRDAIYYAVDGSLFNATDFPVADKIVVSSRLGEAEAIALLRLLPQQEAALAEFPGIVELGTFGEVFADPAKLEVYDRIYSRVSYDVEGPAGPVTVYPPARFGSFGPLPETIREISGTAFLRRFTALERIAVYQAEANDPVIRDFFELLRVTSAAGPIQLDDTDVAAGLDYLATVGILAAHRPAEIRA